MTLIPETNREDGPCVVWIGSTIHGLDDVYGPFPNVMVAKTWAEKKSNIDGSAGQFTCSDYLILMLDQSLIKTDVVLQTGVPTHDNVCEFARAMFPHGFTTQDRDMGEVIIRTGLRPSENPDLEDGPLERCYDDNDNEIPVDYSWEEQEEEDAQTPIVTLDLKSACDAMLGICNEVFPGGKIAAEEPKDDIEMLLDEIEATPVERKAFRYTDDVRLATWAKLAEAGNDTNAPVKPLDEITEADMDAWWEGFNA